MTDHGERTRIDVVTAALGGLLLAYFLVPVAAMLAVVTPAGVAALLSDPWVTSAALRTLLTATASTSVATLLGVPLGLWLARTSPRARAMATPLVVVPLVVPPVVSGMALLSVVGPAGLGRLIGTSLDGTLVGVVLAQTFVAAPFVVLSTTSAVQRVDSSLVEAARSLGDSPLRATRRVTLPLASRGILAGVTLAFARAAGEFGATLMVAYHPRTLPVEVWVAFRTGGLDAAYPVAVGLIVVALAAVVVVRLLGGRVAVGG